MSYLKPNTAGVYDIPSANIDTLYVKGKKFQDYILELNMEDQFDIDQINELKQILLYLNTSGLSTEWIVNNDTINAELKTAITALQTKLANIDTTALTETSVLNNDNRNSVLKTRLDTAATDITALTTRVTTAETDIDNLETRMTTAETDIDNLETRMTTAEGDIDSLETRETAAEADIAAIEAKTDYIVVTNGDPADATTTHGIFIGNKLSVPEDATKAAKKAATFSVGRLGQGFAVEYDPSITTPSATGDGNRVVMNNTFGGHAIIQASHTRIQGGAEINIGEVGLGSAAYETINIGGSMSLIQIGSIEDPVLGTTPTDPATGKSTVVKIGKIGTLKNTWTYLQGNIFLTNARFEDLPRTDKYTWTQIGSLIKTAGLPLWVVSFALTSGIPNFEYSDTFVLKDGGVGENKTGEATTTNDLKTSSLVIFNRDLNIARLTPVEGTFVARGTISKTVLDGSIRNSCFLDGGGDNVIALKHHNIAASDIADWATTEANSKVNVMEIGGDSGILIHQGSSNAGTDLKLVNTKGGNIVLKCGATNGILADAKVSFTVLHDANQPGAAIGRLSTQAADTDETNRTNNPIARLEVECVPNRNGIRLFGYDPAQPFTMLPQETTINNQSVSTQSLVFNGNYTGDTTARLYKNADNKLMWNGTEVGAGGVSSGGITYMINVPTNITDPNPTPTETIMTAAYSGNAQRTITQAITANTAYYIAKYTTEVFDEASNPVLTGLQQLNQYLVWNSTNQVGQIYGRLWFQATAAGSATLYQRTYASPVTTTAASLINGTPIPTPKGEYYITFQRVVFPNINVVVSSGPVVLRHRVEGLVSGSWSALYTMSGAGQSVASSTNNLTVTLDETITLANSIPGATALRLVLFIVSGTGTISQTSAGGADLGAYSLIGVGANTPGLFRTLLYDGTNSKVVTPYSTTPTLIEYDLPIDAPYNVSAFASPTLSTDLYFIQAAGGFANHAITLYFNDGSISHYHSTISPPQVTPTLAQVLNSGATASQAIDMNTNKISGITTLEGAANGNWNVKEITAGTNISVTPTNGSYAIANTAPVQDVVASTGITIGYNATTKTSTIYNNAAVQNLTAGTGISISTDPATRIATITNTASGAVTPASVAGTVRDEHQILMEVGALPRKPDYWATNWSVASNSVGSHRDIYVSVDGRLIVSAIYATGIKRNTNYGIGDFNISYTIIDAPRITTLCGTSSGSKLFAFGFYISQTLVQSLAYFTSTDEGLTWTRITSDTFSGLTQSNRVRCSGDGTYILATISTLGTQGRCLFSSDGGATWVIKNINASLGSGYTNGVAMSRSGAVQFITWINDTENNSKVFRSIDYGATWTEVFGHISGGKWSNIETDATGRYVWATRFDTINNPELAVWYSDNYGSSWVQAVGWNSIEEIWISGTGQFVVGVTVPNPYISGNRYLTISRDYGRSVSYHNLGNTTTFRVVNGSADGSVLVIGSSDETEGSNPSYTGDGLIRVARQGQQNIQDLIVLGGTLSKANGVYTIATDELWFSGGYEVQTGNPLSNVDFDWLSAGKIDLTQFNIRYEIECYWSTGTNAYIYPLLTINGISNIDVAGTNDNANYGPLSGETNWTNTISNPSWGVANAYVQSYRNRFFAGYFPASTTDLNAPANINIRQKSIIKGTLSLHRRPAAQTGIIDASPNARDILNIFTCDNYATQFTNGMSYVLSSGTVSGIDYGVNHQRINGTGIFTTEPVWTWDLLGGGSQMALGIFRMGLRLVEGGSFTTRPRAAHYTYRIYRERK